MAVIRVRAIPDAIRNGVSLVIVRDRLGGLPPEVATDFQWTEFPEGGMFPQSSLRLTTDYAQDLMESLWGAGLRPSAGRQSEGMTAAQQKHLDDLRTIAFHALKIGK